MASITSSVTKLNLIGGTAAIKPAERARRLPAVTFDTQKLRLRAGVIIREILTWAAVAGLMWFQWQILRCSW